MISGIGWVSELVEIAGGIDIFADRREAERCQGRFFRQDDLLTLRRLGKWSNAWDATRNRTR